MLNTPVQNIVWETVELPETVDNIVARLACTFAHDVNNSALGELTTNDREALALYLADVAWSYAEGQRAIGRDAFPCDFVEACAQHLSSHHCATLGEVLEAGAAESEALANA